MTDKESAERAVKDPNPIIDGRKANVNLAYLGAKPRNNTNNGELKLIIPSTTIYIQINSSFWPFIMAQFFIINYNLVKSQL